MKRIIMSRAAWLVVVAIASHCFTEALAFAPFGKEKSVSTAILAARRDGRGNVGTLIEAPFTSSGDESFVLRRQASALQAATGRTTSTDAGIDQDSMIRIEPAAVVNTLQPNRALFADIQSVLTTALLVTGNTVGAGALALPELAAKPGLAISTGMFSVAYVVNLMSGLILAEVAIKQNESRGDDVPSSFREFAEASLDSSQTANAVSSVSLFVNTCALTYSLGRAGCILEDLIGGAASSSPMITIDHFGLSTVFAGLLAVMATTQSRVRISQISSVFVAVLFLSVSGLILPGLTHVTDPVDTMLAPGTSTDVMEGVLEAAPIMLTTLIFQNIVPPVAKILDYDRTKTVIALMIGSFLPLVLYLSWSFVVLGGGVDTNVGIDSPLMTAFSVAAVTGSAIGCTMAVAEELQAFLDSNSNNDSKSNAIITDEKATIDVAVVQEESAPNKEQEDIDTGYALPAVLTAVVVPLVCSAACNEYTDALKLSGSYGIPVLYGAIPVVMAWTQREESSKLLTEQQENLIPGGAASLALVATAFGAFMVNSVVADVGRIIV